MNDAVRLLRSLLMLNTKLWLNCLEGVTDEAAWSRSNTPINNAGFIALHLIDARFFMADLLGLEAANPYAEALAEVRSPADLPEAYQPSLDELRRVWQEVSDVLLDGVPTVEEAVWRRTSPQRFPVEDPSVLGGMHFLVNHESYHIGQLALLRKYLGLPAMKYT